jgi:hypothetical protein
MSTNTKKKAVFHPTAEKIAVMQAFLDGKKIEATERRAGGGWNPLPVPCWNWDDFVYRVKKEPVVLYVNVYDRVCGGGVVGSGYATEAEAAARRADGGRTIKMIEVLED